MTARRGVIVASLLACSSFVSQGLSQGQAPRLVRSLSGPSGKVVGQDFVLDEVRNRFVFPNDRSATIYFEWECPAGDHALTATWKRPDGGVASVSPDVKIQTTSTRLTSYWMFDISSAVVSGTWTVEIRIDGQPAGSHVFEVAGTDGRAEKFTLDRVMKTFGPAVVAVFKLDEGGHRVDASSGCVIGPNAVVTAFQAVDMATVLEIEFADGRRARTADLLDVSRLDDWAVIKVDTGAIAPIPRGDARAIPVGGRLATFSIDGGTRVMLPVDVGAVSTPPGYGLRIRFSPHSALEAAGSPLIDENGLLVGLVGGSLTPGSRLIQRVRELSSQLLAEPAPNTGSAINLLPATLPTASRSLADLQGAGVISAPITPMPEFDFGGVTKHLPKNVADQIASDDRDYSTRDDTPVTVYSYWKKKGKLSKGEISGAIFDASNQPRGSLPAKKISLKEQGERISYAFDPRSLPAGYYRIDLRWDGTPVWRIYIHVTD